MGIETATEVVASHDGGQFSAHLALPSAGSGPGVLLLQEIAGVNEYLRTVAARLADLGYVVLAPDMFWRIAPDTPLEFADDLGTALERAQQFDFEEGLRDCDAALAHLSRMDAVTGSVGVLGFCMGGRLAFSVAVRSEPDAVVSYYGSGIVDALDSVGAIHCPMLLHFGDQDPFIPPDQVLQIEEALASRSDVTVHHYEAGHAFDNFAVAIFHQPLAAQEAWGRTVDFLRRTLGP